MHIKFHNISYKNLLSTGNAAIEIDFEKANKNLIVGENGDGKSSLLDALHFCLFGTAFRDINKGMLVNSINGKQCRVEVSFTTGGHHYRVVRGISPAIFDIIRDGVQIPQDSNTRDYQHKLENDILGGLTSKLFRQVVVLGSANYVPFMQLTAADRRAVVENMLDMNVFASMLGMFKDHASDIKFRHAACASKISVLSTAIRNYTKGIEDQDDLLAKAERMHAERLAVENRLLESDKEKLAKLEAEAPIASLDKERETLRIKQNRLMEKKGQCNVNMGAADKDLAFFSSHDVCPTCHQSIDASFKDDKISSLKIVQDQLNNELHIMAAVQKKLDEALRDISEKEKAQRQHDQLHNALVTSIKQHEAKISGMSERSSLAGLASTDQIKKMLEKTEADMAVEQKELNNLTMDMEAVKVLGLMLKDSGIKAEIMKKYIPMINTTINQFLGELGFFVQFTVDEQFNEVIKSRYRDTFSYNSFSQGEKLRIDVAILFTWRALMRARNGISTNLLIMDEILDGSIDNTGAEDFLRLLDKVAQTSKVFIISHRGDALSDKFERVLSFEKKGNYTVVNEGS